MCGCRAPQSQTGYRLEAVTVRKLEFENDAFAFGDKLVEKWYETVEAGRQEGRAGGGHHRQGRRAHRRAPTS